MLQKFKSLSKGKKVIALIISFIFLPLILIGLSVNLTLKGIKSKKTIKIIAGVICTLFTFLFAIGCYSASDTDNQVANNTGLNVEGEILKEEPKENIPDTSGEVDKEDVQGSTDESTESQQEESLTETDTATKDNEDNESTVIESTLQSEIHFINTGNSDSILIKHGDKGILIDGGDNNDEGLVTSYLKQQGIKTIEYMIATHPDADHIGGLDEVLNNFTVNNLLVSNGDADTKTYTDFINAAANNGVNPSVPLQGTKYNMDSATFEIISCANVKEPNDRSIVVLYTNGKDKLLFMGDADTEITDPLILSDVDLIKVSHHGSNTGTNKTLLEKITPEYAVLTVGSNNKYGHPHKEVMDLLKDSNIPVYRTDEGGNIVFESTGNGLKTDNQSNSYDAGATKEVSTSTPSSTSSTNNNSSSNNTDSTSDSSSTNTQDNANTNEKSEETVYWVPKGTVYHSRKSCPALSRSKDIRSGTIEQSAKPKHCSKC